MRNLIEYLPTFMQKSKIYKAIFDADTVEIEEYINEIEELNQQLNIDTATWALEIYEKDLGIQTDLTLTLNERRAQIKSRERGKGVVTADLIKNVAESYFNGTVEVDFDGNIQISYVSDMGIPTNQSDLEKAIENLKPAHLDVVYNFLYRFYSEVETYTHGELASYTHNTIREGEIV